MTYRMFTSISLLFCLHKTVNSTKLLFCMPYRMFTAISLLFCLHETVKQHYVFLLDDLQDDHFHFTLILYTQDSKAALICSFECLTGCSLPFHSYSVYTRQLSSTKISFGCLTGCSLPFHSYSLYTRQ